MGMGGKSSGGSKDYYGHAPGVICQGQLDFFGGLLVNNTLVYPDAKLWDAKIYRNGTTIIYVDGNAYKASTKTSTDPNAFPWVLLATPWIAGTYHAGDKKLYLGNVWECVSTTAVSPPSTAPARIPSLQEPAPVNGWIYVSTPQVWVAGAGSNFWDINSIVVWKGKIWTNPITGTKGEPGISGDWIVWKIDRGSSPNPLKFTVPQMGDVYLYWGTPTQTLDTVNEGILSAFGHPAYRNLSIIVLKNFLFGTAQVNPPDVVILGGRKPVQSLIINNTGVVGVDATAFDADWNVNPWCVIAEKLTHPIFGLGLPLSMFNATAWQAEADRCAANPQLFYISPMWTSLSSARQLVADLLGYPDAFIFWTTLATLTAGHWPHGESVPAFTGDTTIDRNDLIAEIATDSNGWDDTASAAIVSFQDVQAGFKSRPATQSNLFNMAVTQRVKFEKSDMPFITRFAQAAAWAAEKAKTGGDQTSGSTLKVRAEKATVIEPGSIFLLTNDEFSLSEPQRCTKKVKSLTSGVVQLTHATERGLAPQAFAPATVNPTSNPDLFPSAIKNALFVQIPSSLGTGANQLACIATRSDAITSSMDIWYRQKDGSAWQDLGNQAGFAVGLNIQGDVTSFVNVFTVGPGVITVGDLIIPGKIDPFAWDVLVQYDNNQLRSPPVYTDGVEGVDFTYDPNSGQIVLLTTGSITDGAQISISEATAATAKLWASTPQPDLDDVSSPLTQDEIYDNEYLVFMFKASDPTQFEIAGLVGVSAIGGGDYNVSMRRGLYGTLLGGDGSYMFTTGDLMFIVKREHLLALTHADFADLQAAAATATLRLASNSAWKQGDHDDLEDDASNPEGLTTEWTHTFNNRYAPTVTVLSQQKNGADIADWTGIFVHSDVIQLLLGLADLNGDLAHVAVSIVKADTHLPILTKNYDPTDSATVLLQFSFPVDGSWKIRVDCLDSAGNQSTTFIPGDGTGIRVDNGSNTSDSPLIYSYDIVGSQVENLFFGLFRDNNFTVHWQIKNRGVAPDAQGAGGGVWSTIAATTAVGGSYKTNTAIPRFKKGKKTLYAYSTHSGGGLSTSTTVQFNIDK